MLAAGVIRIEDVKKKETTMTRKALDIANGVTNMAVRNIFNLWWKDVSEQIEEAANRQKKTLRIQRQKYKGFLNGEVVELEEEMGEDVDNAIDVDMKEETQEQKEEREREERHLKEMAARRLDDLTARLMLMTTAGRITTKYGTGYSCSACLPKREEFPFHWQVCPVL